MPSDKSKKSNKSRETELAFLKAEERMLIDMMNKVQDQLTRLGTEEMVLKRHLGPISQGEATAGLVEEQPMQFDLTETETITSGHMAGGDGPFRDNPCLNEPLELNVREVLQNLADGARKQGAGDDNTMMSEEDDNDEASDDYYSCDEFINE